MEIESSALVLKSRDIKENDRLITLLTEEQGVVSAFANGAKKPKNPLHGGAQPWAYGRYALALRRDFLIVTECRADGVFFKLAADLDRLSLAAELTTLFERLAPREAPAAEELRLALNSLHFLNEGARPLPFLRALTTLRLLTLAGYRPPLETPGFAPPDVCRAAHVFCEAPLEKAFALALPEEILLRTERLAQQFLAAQNVT